MGLGDFLHLFFPFSYLGPAKTCWQLGKEGSDLTHFPLPTTLLVSHLLGEAVRTVTVLL